MRHKVEGQWVVPDMVIRCRSEWGLYMWNEYDKFAHDRGIRLRHHDRRDLPVAFHRGRTVYVHHCRSDLLTARRIWHEMSHIVCFPLNYLYWESVDWGEFIISKTERRTNDFVRFFPVWDMERPLW